MSWLTKVTDIAGRAEDFLNRIDQNTADVLKKPRAGTPGAHSVQLTRVESEASLPNESTHSAPGIDTPYRPTVRSPHAASYSASSSSRLYQYRKKEEDDFISFLNDGAHETTLSRHSSNASHTSLPVQHPPTPSHSVPSSTSAVGDVFIATDPNAELRAQHSDALKCLHLKESQMAVMSVRLQEAEEAVARKEARLTELLKENEALREGSRPLRSTYGGLSPGSELNTAMDRIEAERKRERDELERREAEHVKRLERANAEKSQLINEVQAMKASLAEMELASRRHVEELRLAKYNLEANKHEFDEYKQKAQKILNSKEKLLETLKQGGAENSGIDKSVSGVELEELRCERELLKEELQQSQLAIYNLKADIQDMENRLREEQKASGAHREALLEQCHRHLSEANQYREQMERAQLEYEFLQAEMRRQEEAVDRKLAEKDVELMKLMEERKMSKKYEVGEAEQRIALMSEKLIAKQTDIERLEGEKRALALRLERSERAYRQAEAAAVKACAIDMRETAGVNVGARGSGFLQKAPGDSFSVLAAKSVLVGIDMLGLRLASFMRSPMFRIFFLVYCILLHAWVFFVLFTYTPEIHPL
uniref:Golgin subfamily A member 5 n=1 Tax=Ascaris suum TaxID=6253 RepID=F1KZA4_ASCSU